MDRTLSNGGPSPKNGCTIRYLVGPSKISQLWMELGHLCFGAPFPSIRCIRSNIIPAFSTASSVLEMRRFWSVLTSRVFQEERNGFSKKASIIYSIRVWHGFCCKGSYKFIYIYIYIYPYVSLWSLLRTISSHTTFGGEPGSTLMSLQRWTWHILLTKPVNWKCWEVLHIDFDIVPFVVRLSGIVCIYIYMYIITHLHNIK